MTASDHCSSRKKLLQDGTIHMRRPYQKSPERRGPGLNVSVGASLLGLFGDDDINLEQVEERRIEQDQSNAPPIRFSLRQMIRQGRLNCSA
jgi:hypothetical protein